MIVLFNWVIFRFHVRFLGAYDLWTHTQQNPTKHIPQTTNPNDGGRIDVQFEWLVLNVSPVSRVPWKWEKNIYPPGVLIGAVVVVVLFCRLSTTPPKFNKFNMDLRIHPWKRKIIFQTIIFRFYVNVRGCTSNETVKPLTFVGNGFVGCIKQVCIFCQRVDDHPKANI